MHRRSRGDCPLLPLVVRSSPAPILHRYWIASRRSGARPLRGPASCVNDEGAGSPGSSMSAPTGKSARCASAEPVLHRNPGCAGAVFCHRHRARHGTQQASPAQSSEDLLQVSTGQDRLRGNEMLPGEAPIPWRSPPPTVATAATLEAWNWVVGEIGLQACIPTVSGSNRRLDGIREPSAAAVEVLPQPKVPFSQTITWS